ncbi:MAG: hemerythrin [Hydrogenophaga sp.]|uniref:bacteriohemerythrin n=1 Tax=Hydrogenophaga sp. TaxID=1904254 RepID=UPI002ABC77AC|nr:hemerythrin [Hydrogenophaga sp.]MDZ4187109.1 hemerythrin [Hydrogenophaga sp.]
MNTIEWTDALVLDFEPIDTLHHAFVDLLAQAQQAPDDALPQAWTALVNHTMAQFDWEDTWMQRTGFSSAPNHTLQHRVVLNLLREGLAMARTGQLAAVREMADELAAWFAKHTQSQDAALALHMRRHPTTASNGSHRRRTRPTAQGSTERGSLRP